MNLYIEQTIKLGFTFHSDEGEFSMTETEARAQLQLILERALDELGGYTLISEQIIETKEE